MPMKVLFVSRAYPPVTGGIENQNYALHAWLSRDNAVTLIRNPYGKKGAARLSALCHAQGVDCFAPP